MDPRYRAWLCENLAPLQQAAARFGRSTDVESLVAEVQADPEVPRNEDLQALSRQVGGPEVDLRGRGVGGMSGGADFGVRLPGPPGGLPAHVTYQCPSLGCDREGRRTPGGPVPACALSGTPMTMTATAP